MAIPEAAGHCRALFYFLGSEHVVAGAFISLASAQFSGWMFWFVPMQAGTAEGSALVLFGAVGLAPHVGLMVEIGRKARRLVFIVLGVTVLGWGTFRRLTSGESLRPAEDEA